MFKLFYSKTMQPVQFGDVVHFAGRKWTVEEIVEAPKFLDTKLWVRSMDEQRLTISAYNGDIGARWVETK